MAQRRKAVESSVTEPKGLTNTDSELQRIGTKQMKSIFSEAERTMLLGLIEMQKKSCHGLYERLWDMMGSGLGFATGFVVYPVDGGGMGQRNGNIKAVFVDKKSAEKAKEETYGAYSGIEEVQVFALTSTQVYVLDLSSNIEGPYTLGEDLESGRKERLEIALAKLSVLSPEDIEALKSSDHKW